MLLQRRRKIAVAEKRRQANEQKLREQGSLADLLFFTFANSHNQAVPRKLCEVATKNAAALRDVGTVV